MRKNTFRRTAAGVAVCSALFFSVFTALSFSISISADGKNDTSALENPSEAEEIYVLKEYNGEIGIFYKGELIMESEVPVSSLRAADRELIENGIYTDSYRDVLLLLEDFNS